MNRAKSRPPGSSHSPRQPASGDGVRLRHRQPERVKDSPPGPLCRENPNG